MRTTLKQTLATMAALGALLMLCTTACTQHADLPLPSTTPAQGGEPLMLSVAPKQAFAQADADANNPHTRATVDTDGTNFAWQVDDVIYVNYSFSDAATTKVYHRWVYTGAGASDQSYLTDWNTYAGWADNGAAAPTITYPVGATGCDIRAFYFDCKCTANYDANTYELWNILLDYSKGTGDQMLFVGSLTVETPSIEVKLEHLLTRVVFTGLKPKQAYSLRANGTPLKYTTSYPIYADDQPQTFTTDDQGNLVVCPYLTNAMLDDATHKLTLDVMTGGALATDACISTVELTGKRIDGEYTLRGLQCTVDVKSYAGDNDPDHIPNLLPPLPIVATNKVYSVNGYWVTAPDANEDKDYTWGNNTEHTAATMTNDPCKAGAAQGWRMPVMKDFEAMGGLEIPWDETVSTSTEMTVTTDATAFFAAFSSTYFWSSQPVTGQDLAWSIKVANNKVTYITGYKGAKYGIAYRVRCVQKQKP